MYSLYVIKVLTMNNFKTVVLTALLLIANSAAVFGAEKAHVVDIPEGSKVFVPEIVTITAGDTVRWTNNDHAKKSHQFASIPGAEGGKEIPVTILKQDKQFEHTFKEPGEYRYFCFVHRGMNGTIIVKPAE